MEKHQSVFVSTYEEGTKKVLGGNYAFLMESTMIDYAVQRDCNLTQISGLLDSKGYGIATPKGSVWRDKLSLAVLELQEKGVIQMLYDKWWKNAADICIKDEKVKEFKPKPLDLNDLGKCTNGKNQLTMFLLKYFYFLNSFIYLNTKKKKYIL